ncbi:MAG TPA: glycine cleavage system protein GcvH [Trebonia sp.]|jgi:glycine cleavage system H protein|nr:glycine cleavage system protein GcvH [Trebonia sp.]
MTEKEETQPDWPAVSLAFGPVPAIYVPPSLEQPSVRDQHVSIGGTMPDIPVDLKYSQDHLWARSDAGTCLVRIGVTDFAQQSLGDVVAVTLPAPGDTVKAGEACGDIESVKSVSDLVTPITGTVRVRNDELTDAPDLVNTDPYGQGWMLEIDTDPATLDGQLSALMDASAYRELTGA